MKKSIKKREMNSNAFRIKCKIQMLYLSLHIKRKKILTNFYLIAIFVVTVFDLFLSQNMFVKQILYKISHIYPILIILQQLKNNIFDKNYMSFYYNKFLAYPILFITCISTAVISKILLMQTILSLRHKNRKWPMK